MIVLKFGGSSVGSAESIKQVVNIINKDTVPQIVVLSAVYGTTNALVEISNSLKNNLKTTFIQQVNNLENSYDDLISNLYTNQSYKEKAQNFIGAIFNQIRNLSHKKSHNQEAFILAQGELISTNLMQFYLEEQQILSSLISALDFMKIDANGEPDLASIKENIQPILSENSTKKLWITQGFICRNEQGEISNLKRGGSDYTASLIGAAIQAQHIEIWTDIDGMHNNDPRYVENTFSIDEISFDEAAELAYFGAKILHPQSLIPAKENNIPVLLKNTFAPEKKGTIIKNDTIKKGVTAIAAKDGITAIKIKSYRMLLAYGFLKNIFEIFETYKTPIDMITTSEVAVSLTIDSTKYLNEITQKLACFGKVQVDEDLSIICVAGDFSQNKEGEGIAVFNALKGIPIRMISYGGSNYNISFLVKTTDKVAALNALHIGLFTQKAQTTMKQLIGV